ncbi:hypothetical protein DRO54_06990 [Candidatus Bathyarchaeota archaeon]|nr:MAG: hypothetical protein DRO54_06990 [Candidatus Bathyarchaeota archaeon]
MVKVKVPERGRPKRSNPVLKEIILTDSDENYDVLRDVALAIHRAGGLMYAIVDWNDVEDMPLNTLVVRDLPKDFAELSKVMMKYGVISVYVVMEVVTNDMASKMIGKGGWKVKKLARYLGSYVKIVGRVGGGGVGGKRTE